MKKQLMIIGGILLAVILFIFIKQPEETQELPLTPYEDVEKEIESDSSSLEPSVYTVDLKGEVKAPGIYEIDPSCRVHDVIELAGGFLETANVNVVNLAEKVKDEMVIYIPHVDEEETPIEAGAQKEQQVSLNRASLAEFQTLPGIGPAKASAIIDYREEFGTFKSIEDLINVTGIGEKTLEKLRDYLEL